MLGDKEAIATIEKNYADETARRWSEAIHALDGFVFVTPEYNHGYPGNLKNAIDHVQTGWWYKPIAFLSYGGAASGGRAVEQLRSVAVEVRTVPVRGEVNLRLIGLALDEHPEADRPVLRAARRGDDRPAAVVGARFEGSARAHSAAAVSLKSRHLATCRTGDGGIDDRAGGAVYAHRRHSRGDEHAHVVM